MRRSDAHCGQHPPLSDTPRLWEMASCLFCSMATSAAVSIPASTAAKRASAAARRSGVVSGVGVVSGSRMAVCCLVVFGPCCAFSSAHHRFRRPSFGPRLDQGQRRRSVGLFLFGLRGSVRRRLHGERLVSDRTRCLDTPPCSGSFSVYPPPLLLIGGGTKALLWWLCAPSTDRSGGCVPPLAAAFHPAGTTCIACGSRPRPDWTRRSRPAFMSRRVIRLTVDRSQHAILATVVCLAKYQTRRRLMAQVAPFGPASAPYAMKIAFSAIESHGVAAHAAKKGLGLLGCRCASATGTIGGISRSWCASSPGARGASFGIDGSGPSCCMLLALACIF